MAYSRTWAVRSNSFRAGYEIRGESLEAAIRDGFSRICRETLPASGARPVRARAEWRPDIFAQRGGVEMVIEAMSASGAESAHPVWISALPSDMPDPLVLESRRAA